MDLEPKICLLCDDFTSFFFSKNIFDFLNTCMPNILDPNVGAGSKKQPMNRDKQKTNHVGRDGNANEEY